MISKEPIGRPELLRQINRARVFDILKNERVISRPDLAKRTGLSRAAIAVVVDDLLQAGLAQETGLGESTGGRPPVLLEFSPKAILALGARMQDRDWGIVATSLDAEVVRRLDIQIPDDTAEGAVNALREGVLALTTSLKGARVLPAIGLGTPGLVDLHTGVIKSAVDVGWVDVPFRKMVEESLGLKAFVANRSKVGALAELWYGAKRGVNDLIYISIGTGVSAGIIHAGDLYVGANSSAGELGHTTILPEGPSCPCGNRGCLQQLVSGPAIANRAREHMRRDSESLLWTLAGNHPELITAVTVFQAAERGDRLACNLVEEAATYLGIAIANLIDLFNPELIVLGGPLGRAGQLLVSPLEAEVRRRAMTYPLSAVQIVTSTLGPDTGAIGAAVLVLQRIDELAFPADGLAL